MIKYPSGLRLFLNASNLKKLKIVELTKKSYAFAISKVLVFAIILVITVGINFSIILKAKEQKYISSFQKAHITLSETFRTMSVNEEIDNNTTTEYFAKNILPKYIKVVRICDNAKDCDFPEKVKRLNGTLLSAIPKTMENITEPNGVTKLKYINHRFNEYSIKNATTKNHNNSYFFITSDGFHVMFFYNPYCVHDEKERPYYWTSYTVKNKIQKQFSLDSACFWGLYDMNGKGAPNRVGNDIGFIGSFYNGYNAQAISVLPYKSKEKATQTLGWSSDHVQRANDYCNKLDGNNYKLPDINELSLMYLNREFLSDANNKWFWSSTPLSDSEYFRGVYFGGGYRDWDIRTFTNGYVYCVRKI